MKDNTKSLTATLRQESRRLGTEEANSVQEAVQKVLALCELVNMSKQMMHRIGAIILKGAPTIIAPACPDYTHEDGKYTFKGVNRGISLLTQLHIHFLRKVKTIIPEARIVILIADHEADDNQLCTAIDKTSEEFRSIILASVSATNLLVRELGWSAEAMTDFIPGLISEEQRNAKLIREREDVRIRIDNDTGARIQMYKSINPELSLEQMRERTIIAAAQYLALGQTATTNNWIVCNHSTVNLCWYKEAGTAVLHNDVAVY